MVIVYGITFKQPWASMVACEMKSIELRTFRVAPGTRLTICAGLAVDERGPDLGPLPAGVRLCEVEVMSVTPATVEDAPLAGVDSSLLAREIERAAASSGRTLWSWHLRLVRSVAPVAQRGMPGLFPLAENAPRHALRAEV
jgi:hypothetical protein